MAINHAISLSHLLYLRYIMPREKIILDPNYLINRLDHLALHRRLNTIHIHNCRDDDIHHIRKQNIYAIDIVSTVLTKVFQSNLSQKMYFKQLGVLTGYTRPSNPVSSPDV